MKIIKLFTIKGKTLDSVENHVEEDDFINGFEIEMEEGDGLVRMDGIDVGERKVFTFNGKGLNDLYKSKLNIDVNEILMELNEDLKEFNGHHMYVIGPNDRGDVKEYLKQALDTQLTFFLKKHIDIFWIPETTGHKKDEAIQILEELYEEGQTEAPTINIVDIIKFD